MKDLLENIIAIFLDQIWKNAGKINIIVWIKNTFEQRIKLQISDVGFLHQNYCLLKKTVCVLFNTPVRHCLQLCPIFLTDFLEEDWFILGGYPWISQFFDIFKNVEALLRQVMGCRLEQRLESIVVGIKL